MGAAKAKAANGFKIISDNRSAGHDYELMERLEAGMVLTGTEVKACRAGKVQLKGGNLLNHSRTTIPFPTPKTGEEAMFNFLLHYAGGGYDREYSWFPVRANGDYYRVGYTDRVVYA